MSDISNTRAGRVIRFIESRLRVPEGDMIGQKIVLEKFQKDFIIDIYNNPAITKKAILSMARKNAKTATIAMITLAHLVGPEAKLNSRIVSGALSKEQASEVYNYAVKMVTLSPELSEICKATPSKKTLYGIPLNITYRALSAEGKTNMGGSPVLAILDETGQVVGPQNDFIDSVTTSQGAYEDALLIVISTQAATDSDLLSIWIDDAVESKDPKIVCHLYTTPIASDLLDEKSWYLSNPALGKFRSLTDLRSNAAQASRMPSAEASFRNLCLNQRVSTNSPFISRSVWQSCDKPAVPIEDCTEIYGGLDLSKRTDLSALVLYGYYENTWNVYPFFWTPLEGLVERSKKDKAPYDVWVKNGFITATPGATIDYSYIAAKLTEVFELDALKGLAYDRWRMDVLRDKLTLLGVDVEALPLVDWGQGFKDMSPALEALEANLLDRKINHGGNPVLNMCAHNTMVSSDAAGNRKPDKLKTSGRIDGFVALAMAAGIAERQHEEQGNLDEFLSDPIKV